MEECPVVAVEIFSNLLDHQHMAFQVGHQRCADHHRQRHQVERGISLAGLNMRFERRRIGIDHPVERTPNRRFSAFTPDIGGHRPVHHSAYATAIEAAQQISGIAIPHVELVPRCRFQPTHRILGNPARAITATHEPYGIESRVVGEFDKRLQPLRIGSGEVAAFRKALVVENEFGGLVGGRGECGNARGILAGERG